MARGNIVSAGLIANTLHIAPTARFGVSFWGPDWNMGYDVTSRHWQGDEYKKRGLYRALLRKRPDQADQIMHMMCFPKADHDIFDWPKKLNIDVRYADKLLMDVISATYVAEVEPFVEFFEASGKCESEAQ